LEIKNRECDFSKINRPAQLEQAAGGWRWLSAKEATALNCYFVLRPSASGATPTFLLVTVFA